MLKLRLLVAFVVLALVQMACGMPSQPLVTETPAASQTATEGPRVVTATAGPQQPTTVTSTNSAVPTTAPAAAATQASDNPTSSYLLRAMAGQTMTVKVTSTSPLALTVYGLDDGQPLVRSVVEVTEWTGDLTLTQDYMIMVVPAVDSASYTLEVGVETDRASYFSLDEILAFSEPFEPWCKWLALRVLSGNRMVIPEEPETPYTPRKAFL